MSTPLLLGVEEERQSNVSLMASSPSDCISQNLSGLQERNYLGLSDCSSVDSSAASSLPVDNKNKLNLKATELRLGLPGSESPEREPDLSLLSSGKLDEKPLFPLLPSKDGICPGSQKNVVSGNKRGFSDTMDRFSEVKSSVYTEKNWMFSVGPDSESPQSVGQGKFPGNSGMNAMLRPTGAQQAIMKEMTPNALEQSRPAANGTHNKAFPSGLHKPKSFPETTFKTISGASVSANVSTARTGNQSALFASDVQEPAASFESTASFAAIPLQPVPRGSGPLNGFMSGPLERGFASGPLDRGGGFMSGPIERGVMSGPLDASDKSNFSAPLARGRRRPRLHRLMRSVSGPMRNTLSRTFSKHTMGSGWMERFFLHPVTRLAWQVKEAKYRSEAQRNCLEGGPSEGEYGNSRNLQWAHGKAGEDRVHVVLSEEQGWLFIGIYDGFSGPDAPDFLMSHLYRAIDKELEGLLWDYEDKSPTDHPELGHPKCQNAGISVEGTKVDQPESCLNKVSYFNLKESCNSSGMSSEQSFTCEIVEESGEVTGCTRNGNITGRGRKSMRLYELLQIESWDGQGSALISDIGPERKGSSDCQACQDTVGSSENLKGDDSIHRGEDPTTSGGDGRVGLESNQDSMDSLSVSVQRQSTRKSLISSKIRKMYRKQKSLRKKLFPWSYDWHREEPCIDERMVESSGPIRKCKSGIIDHDAVLRAMAQALESTEEAYMEMVEKALDTNPELALMGSCVLVMLMKDQDVYVMNLGDSRAILAQERPNDRHPNPSFLKDDSRHKNRSRESLVRMELDRISEESPMHNQNCQVNMMNKNRDISICRLKMRAVQLSTDHSTSVEEEIIRIKAEHPDDSQAVFNDRVKGQLKVTRAFGAGFLKKPTCNEALLEMFRVDYVGNAPYVSCIPSIVHHRLSSSDRFLVLSSDGLYQYFSNEEVVAHVTWFMENVPEGDPAQYLIAELLFRAAKKNGMDFHELLDIPHGDRRKYHDDVSVMVVSLEGRIWRSSG